MRKTAVLLAAVGIVAAASVPSMASEERIPPPVIIRTGGVCDAGYRPVVQAGSVVVCVTNIRAPRVRPTTTGCVAGETPYLVDNRYGVCTS